MPFQYEAFDPTPGTLSLGRLMQEMAARRADAIRREGDLTAQARAQAGMGRAQMIASIGQGVSGALGAYLQDRAQAPILAAQQRRQALQDAALMQGLEKGESELTDATRKRSREDALASARKLGNAYFAKTEKPTFAGFQSAVGPEFADELWKDRPQPEKLTEHDPTKSLIDASGTVVVPGVPEAPKITYGQPVEVILDGQPAFARPGSDNKYYDANGQAIEGSRIRPKPERSTSAPLPTRASLAAAAAAGDAKAAEALRLMAPSDGGDLPPRVRTSVNQQQAAFRNEPVVKRTNTMAEAVSFVNDLNLQTQNPADDQALIYAFAKAMDPESVVREGEYATVQKYAQSWLSKFGFDARRVVDGSSPLLTPSARKNLKDTIDARYQASRKQYDNVKKRYTDVVNKVTGRDDGADYLIEYESAFPPAAPQTAVSPPAAAGRQRVKGPNGESGTVPAGTTLPPGWSVQ